MKTIIILVGLLFVSCYHTVQNTVGSQENTEPKEEIFSEVSLETGKLTLFNREGRCTLRFDSKANKENQGKTETDLGMIAPCNFVRKPSGDHGPLYYSYQKGVDRRTVLLVAGGPSDPSEKDEFLPNGCGTMLAKVRVFADRVELVRSGETGIFPVCPSEGADEVYFAT